nr:MAG TPA: hypothetical protein [Caudoviricetes sp.]
MYYFRQSILLQFTRFIKIPFHLIALSFFSDCSSWCQL